MQRSIARILASACALACGHAAAQYPDKPINLVVPYAAGGPTDLAGRNLAQYAGDALGQRIIVHNRPGAGGITGSLGVKSAAPDGYTLLIARVGSHAATPAIDPATPYKWNEFTFLSVLELNPTACAARADSPYKSLPELVRHLKANPGKLNYSSSGEGSLPYMTTQVFFSLAGLDRNIAVNVPYKSDGDTVVAMLGGLVDFHCASATAMIPQIKAGKLRGLAVSMPQRMEDELPGVPTAREQGFADLEKMVGWSALYGPPGLPPAVVAKWTETMQKVAATQGWIEGNRRFGGVPAVRSPAETERFAREQFELYDKLVKTLGIKK
jgi:tripartite-type tricarboxylate transporter receptor subunit TctC